VNDRLGTSLAALGDLDGDNVVDLAVGTYADDDGGLNMGAAYIVFLETNGVAKGAQKLSMLHGNFNAFYSLEPSVYFGYTVGALGDVDSDGVLDMASGVWADDDGGTNMGAVYILLLETNGSAKAVQKLSSIYGNLNTFYNLTADDRFGYSVAGLGDLDSDGIADLAAGAFLDDDGGSNRGAVYVVFLETDGSVKNAQKLSMLQGNLGAFYTLGGGDLFGYSVEALGDISGDGVTDLAVGAMYDDDGNTNAGAVYILFLGSDGIVSDAQKLSMQYGNFGSFFSLVADDRFGSSVAALGDLDGDGIIDLAVGARMDDDGVLDTGATYVINLMCVTPSPTDSPMPIPTALPTALPVFNPTALPMPNPSVFPVPVPTLPPSSNPSVDPAPIPTSLPTPIPTGPAFSDGAMSYSYSSLSCTSDCSDEVLSAIGDQEAFCVIEDVSCVSLCLNLDWVDAHCECNTMALFATYSFEFFGSEEYCCGSSTCQAAVKDAFVVSGSLSDADTEALLFESCTTVDCSPYSYSYSFSTENTLDEGAVPYSYSSCTDGTIKNVQKLSALYGNFNSFYALDYVDEFGWGLAALGDLDGDGVTDLAVGANYDDDGDTDTGAVYILFLNTDGNTKNAQKISMLYGNFNVFYTLKAGDRLGVALAALGDLDGDSVVDLAVGAFLDDDGGTNAGAVYVLFLTSDGMVKAAQKLSALYGNFNAFYTLEYSDVSSISVAALGDLNGDSLTDLAVGSVLDDDGFLDAGAVYVLFLETSGIIKGAQKLSMLYGNFNVFYSLDADDRIGISVAALGDLDGDGVTELAVGAELDDDGGVNVGAAYILFLETNGNVKAAQKLSGLYGDFNVFYTLEASDGFAYGMAALGDISGDGVMDMAVGARYDDDGGADTGSVYLVFLESDGTAKAALKISMLYGYYNGVYSLNTSDSFGISVAALGDLDGDGVTDLAVGANFDDDGGASTGAVYIINLNESYCETPGPTSVPVPTTSALPSPIPTVLPASTSTTCFTDGTAKDVQKLSALYGNFNAFYALNTSDGFGNSVAALGDLDDDGVVDLVVGARFDDDGGDNAGAAYVLFLDTNENVKDAQKLSNLYGNFGSFYALGALDYFGWAVAALGDFDGDTVVDLAVGACGDNDGASNAGAVYVLFLSTDGIVAGSQKISSLYGNFNSFYTLDASDLFGFSVAALGDVDKDGVNDLAVGAINDDDGVVNAGALYVLFFNTDGMVKNAQKISMLYGNFATFYTIAADLLGRSVADLGDVDGDGVVDLAVGALFDDDGGDNAGAVYVLFLETTGQVHSAQKISSLYGQLNAFYTFSGGELFGQSVVALGDIDNDKVVDLAVGAMGDDDGFTDAGAVYMLFLESDGNVKSAQKLSNVYGNFGAFYTLDEYDKFGFELASVGDIDGDGVPDLAVGAPFDDDGLTDAGAVYFVNLKQSYCETPMPTFSPVPNTITCFTDGTARNVQKVSAQYGKFDNFYTLDSVDEFGWSLAALEDLDGDGVTDLAVGANYDDDGDFNTGAVYILFLETSGIVKDVQKISMLYGNFNTFYTLDREDRFGVSLAALGDLDSDGVTDLAVGALFDDDGAADASAAYVLFLETSGNVKSAQKISALYGNFNSFYTLDAGDSFGWGLAALGDHDGDGVTDLTVSAVFDDDLSSDTGALYVLFLETSGNVKNAQKISMLYGNFNAFYALDAGDLLGVSVAAAGDIDGDNVVDLAVGAWRDDDGDVDVGAVYVLFLETNANTRDVQKLSALYGNFNTFYTLDAGDEFCWGVAGLGDISGDGAIDVIVSAYKDDDGGTDAGAIYVIYLETNGNVKGAQKISALYGNVGTFYTLAGGGQFGSSVAALGDLDGDGSMNIAVGAKYDDDGGAIYIINLQRSYCETPSPSLIPSLSPLPTAIPKAAPSPLPTPLPTSAPTMVRTAITTSNINVAVDDWVFDSVSATITYGDISNWDVSAVTSLKQTFLGATTFNDDISAWDTSAVTSLHDTFKDANVFNVDIRGWDTGAVVSFWATFYNHPAFNQDISCWDTSSATTMDATFYGTQVFNYDISGWNVASVTNFGYMFGNAAAFNQVLCFDTAGAITTSMFSGSFGSVDTSAAKCACAADEYYDGTTCSICPYGSSSTGKTESCPCVDFSSSPTLAPSLLPQPIPTALPTPAPTLLPLPKPSLLPTSVSIKARSSFECHLCLTSAI